MVRTPDTRMSSHETLPGAQSRKYDHMQQPCEPQNSAAEAGRANAHASVSVRSRFKDTHPHSEGYAYLWEEVDRFLAPPTLIFSWHPVFLRDAKLGSFCWPAPDTIIPYRP